MQNSLWKLGALLGVIGVGFLVLLKAQNEMTDQAAARESFDELAAIDELENLDKPPAEEQTQAGADSPATASAEVPDTPDLQPTPASLASLADASPSPDNASASDSDEPVGNPFAAFAEATPGEDETATESASSLAADADPTSNPFGQLVDSFTRNEAEPPGETEQPPVTNVGPVEAETSSDATSELAANDPQDLELSDIAALQQEPDEPVEDLLSADESSGQSEPRADGTAAGWETLVADADAFNPFEPSDPSGEPADEPASVDSATPAGDTSAESEPAAGGTEQTAAPYEPTSLTALPPADGGPSLMEPPGETDEGEPAGLVQHADFEIDAAGPPADAQIAQVANDEPAGTADDPGGLLIFPGAGEANDIEETDPLSEPSEDVLTSQPTFPSGDTGSAGRSPVREASPTGNNDRLVHPDGTVEMTVRPRSRAAGDETALAAAELNPFDDVPQQGEPESRSQPGPAGEPAPFQAGSATSEEAAQPLFPDLESSSSPRPVQPSAAEVPAAEGSRDSDLLPADLIGIGTISPDTPATPQQAQLTIEKHAPDDAALGQELIYSIVVKNIGRTTAKNVLVEDLVPKGTELQGTDPQAQMSPDKKLVWQLGSMGPDASRTIRIKVIPRQAGQIGSVATVSFEAAVASRTVVTAPQLRLALDGPQEVRVGEKAPYKFVLSNTGSADAVNVYIRNIIPAGFEHPAAQKRDGLTDIEYEVGTLRRGESREVELTLLAVEEGQFQNHAILTADGDVNVQQQQPVSVITSRLKIHRQGPAGRVVGSQARFTNTVSNESSRPLHGVTVTETVPAGVKFVQASDGGYYDSEKRTVIWRLSGLEAGQSRQLQTVLRAEQSGELASTVTARDQQGDQAEASSKLNVRGFSSLTLDVANPSRAIPVGEEVALRLKVRNGGTAVANRVETRVQLPPELTFVSARGPVRYVQQGEWIAFEPIDTVDAQGEQTFDIVLEAASESRDARIVVQLSSAELTRPLSEDKSVVIYAE